MPYSRKFSTPPLHPLFQSALPDALCAAMDGAPGLIALDVHGALTLGAFRLRPADDPTLRADLADAARRGGVGALRMADGKVIIPDLDGILRRIVRAGQREATARVLALARATLFLAEGAAALTRAEDRRRVALARRVRRAIPDAPERAQETLNMFAEDREAPGAPLKIDGWIGPKTTDAFGTLLRKTDPDRLIERFAGKDFWADEDLI